MPDQNPASSDAPPAYQGGATGSVSSPIGVPFYVTDPSTGQPLIGSDGQPVRWAAPVQVTPGERGNLPGQGPGTAPSSGVQFIAPRYFSGDEWLPASLSADQIATLQKRMVQAGLLKSGEAQLGVWDPASVNGYSKLLAFANASGLDVNSALIRWGDAHAADPNAGKAPLTVRVTNPDDLRQAFRAAVIDKLGQGWSQDKIDQMVSAYQGVETSAQTQAYNMQDTGGSVAAPPSPQAFAAAQATQENPLGVQEHDALGFIDQFRKTIGGWA